MGMGVASGGGGGGRRRRRKSRAIMSEINVTPMVDVMLVLLIIFMVAAPMMTAGVPIDLPQAAARDLPSQTQPVTVYRLVCEQTVEEKIVALHDEKRALADGLLSGQSEVKGLDVESLRALLMS